MFHLYFWFHVISTRYSKTLKYSQQYILDHLSGTKVRIWICSDYDAAFSFSCIALCNLIKSFTFSFISFLLQESDSESFKQWPCTLYAYEILPCKVFIDACKLTGEMSIDCSFFLGVWHLVKSVSVTDWNFSWSSIQWACL